MCDSFEGPTHPTLNVNCYHIVMKSLTSLNTGVSIKWNLEENCFKKLCAGSSERKNLYESEWKWKNLFGEQEGEFSEDRTSNLIINWTRIKVKLLLPKYSSFEDILCLQK